MLTSILTPVGHGHNPKTSRAAWFRLAALHSLGAVASAVAVGAILAMLASSVRARGINTWSLGYWGILFVTVIYLPRQLGWTNFPRLLQSTRQVPREWAYDYPRSLTALLFGLGLGSGLYTRIVVPTYYLLFLWPLLVPNIALAPAMWGTYALARSLNVWWLACASPLGDPFSHATRLISALVQRASWIYRANAVLLLAVATFVVVGSR